jgi:hypothetical protein
MDASLGSLPTTIAIPAELSGSGRNIPLIQSDAELSCNFGGVFESVCSCLQERLPPAVPVAVDGEALLAGLQNLPQGGKLLPLLQQTLDSVAAGSGDLSAFVEQLTRRLQSLFNEGGMPAADQAAAEQLAVVLQPLVQDRPELKAQLPAEISAALERISGPSDKPGKDPSPRSLPATSVSAVQISASADKPPALPAGGESAASVRIFSPDTPAFSPAQQGSPENPQAQGAAMTALMAAIKRLAPDNSRPQSAESTLSSITGAVTQGSSAATTMTTVATPAAMPAVSVATPFGQAGWDQALGERIQWLAGQKVQGAQVKLNPANLGPMEVRIQVQNDQASVQFSSHHAVVREALEAALPRLRDMFENSGVQLVNVDVSGGSHTGQQGAMPDTPAPYWGQAQGGDAEMTVESGNLTPLATFMQSGRLDLFA